MLEQSNDDWLCPLCLREDSLLLVPQLVGVVSAKAETEEVKEILSFYFDEWGPTATIPWLLNSSYSREFLNLQSRNPDTSRLFEMLKILTDPSCSGVIPQFATHATKTPKHLNKHLLAGQCQSPHLRNWSLSERLSVLGGLCLLLRSDQNIMDVIDLMYTDCENLVKISSKPNFREADFMTLVRQLCGEDGVNLCRGLLDGITVDSQNQQDSSAYLQNMITEGRCVVCNGSTFEEESEEPGEQILLCDGCNAEVHLKCLNLTTVSKIIIAPIVS